MSAIITSDIHLTADAKDEHRWALFKFLEEQVLMQNAHEVFILGDLTASKDRHPAKLVNRLVNGLLNLQQRTHLTAIHIVKGNHDYVDEHTPFFGFLNHFNNIWYHSRPQVYAERKMLILPHTPDPLSEWRTIKPWKYRHVLSHQTLTKDMKLSIRGKKGEHPEHVICGDIHTPTDLNAKSIYGSLFHYVGSPYNTTYGDVFEPRILFIDFHAYPKEGLVSINTPFPRKWLMEIISVAHMKRHPVMQQAKKGDFVKVRFTAKQRDWNEAKERAQQFLEKHGLILNIVELAVSTKKHNPVRVRTEHMSDKAIVREWNQQQQVMPPMRRFGEELVEG